MVITKRELQRVITKESLRGLQLIYIVLTIGVSILVALLIAVYYSSIPVGADENTSAIYLLTWLHFILASISYVFAIIVYRSYLKRGLGQRPTYPVDPGGNGAAFTPQEMFDIVKFGFMIRVGVFELLAVTGLVLCILTAYDGVLQTFSVYWINLTTVVLMYVLVIWSFPLPSRMISFLERLTQ